MSICLCHDILLTEFIKLECKEEYHGVYGQQSLLQCIVKAVENVTILTVTWKRMEADPLLLEYHKDTSNLTPGFTFAEPSWNKDNMNVSLLLTKTKMADKGVYECMVRTDSGDATATVSLSVTGESYTVYSSTKCDYKSTFQHRSMKGKNWNM